MDLYTGVPVDTITLEMRQKETKNQKELLFSNLKNLKISSRQVTGFEKDKTLNIQEFRPGRSAMQRHCSLRLFKKNQTYSAVLYSIVYVWSAVLRPL